ncbi:uncharacterized protein LOC132725590 [Ruditapes philippinarum]|uniref:uncharacterized protein LOC132725590 n=1 Tax=Ruditapes philippinarum TaxID=129788 RepID=UPI00295BA28A|nr:uncharacterized protein LOC132725590 [Ruditapes philippinarum]
MATLSQDMQKESEKDKRTKNDEKGKSSQNGKTRIKSSKKQSNEPECESSNEKSQKMIEINNNQECMMDLLRSIRNDQNSLVNHLDLLDGRVHNLEDTSNDQYCDYYNENYEGDEMQDSSEQYTQYSNLDMSYHSPLDSCYTEKTVNKSSETSDKASESVSTNNSATASRFDKLASKFVSEEVVSDDVDNALAGNVNNLFRNGLGDIVYENMTKDDVCARPKNCEGLVVVKLNKLIWDVVPPRSRNNDKKLQNIEKSIVKAGVNLTKSMNELAHLESEKGQSFGTILDTCNDALALLGQANVQLNHARRDFLRPELKADYANLCNHSYPFTSELFGDDVSKAAKDIEDCNKMGNRMQYGPSFRARGRVMFRS